VEGILDGLRVKTDAMKAQVKSLEEFVNEARERDYELTKKYQPYDRAKRELENLQKIRDAVKLRLLQEEVEAAFAPAEAGTFERAPPGRAPADDFPR
jgi:hypothetical protein